jgi:hypothetical protein
MKRGNEGVHGETIAKFEFAEAGWNPYSHYYDQSKVDLILRREDARGISYRDVQVKFGRLYDCKPHWEMELFSWTSWRFFDINAFASARAELFIAYVLSHPDREYQGDIFIFRVREFQTLIENAIPVRDGSSRKFYFSKALRSHDVQEGWYLRRKSRFDSLLEDNVINVSKFRRNFSVLD